MSPGSAPPRQADGACDRGQVVDAAVDRTQAETHRDHRNMGAASRQASTSAVTSPMRALKERHIVPAGVVDRPAEAGQPAAQLVPCVPRFCSGGG